MNGTTTTTPESALDMCAGVPLDAPDGAAVVASTNGAATASNGAARPIAATKRSRYDRLEAYVSRKLVIGNSLWRRFCSFLWLPIAFKSGIKFKRIDHRTFHAVLPFRRFNRNWYNAMAGAALLANSEIAGGMYIWGVCGGDHTVVCKNLSYKFLRPCFGPALYRVHPKGDLQALLDAGGEFNIDVDLEIVQQINPGKGSKERRVGECLATFHVTPKTHVEKRRARRKRRH